MQTRVTHPHKHLVVHRVWLCHWRGTLEHSVGKQVEDTSHVTQTTMVVIYSEANAESYEHVGNLRG